MVAIAVNAMRSRVKKTLRSKTPLPPAMLWLHLQRKPCQKSVLRPARISSGRSKLQCPPSRKPPLQQATPAPVTSNPVTIEQTATPAETVKQATHTEVAPVVQGLPSAVLYELPVDRLQQVAHDSGLIWVNSDAEKIAAVQAAIAAEPPVVRIPRERPAAVVVNEGPLVLVETRKDLNQLKVPF